MYPECKCGSGCIRSSSKILKCIEEFYLPCENCEDPQLKKFKALEDQLDLKTVDANFKGCKCKKRHLDTVMAHTLKIMIEEGLRDERSTLRNTCTPLITPAYPTRSPPYLSEGSMVIIADNITETCANRIVREIPEIKGVINGDINQIVGLKDSNSESQVYELLAGCDMRCDVVLSPYGPLCIYRNQAEIHVEFSKPRSPKMDVLKKIMDKYDAPDVLDCTCGPGTLGIACLKAGARRVVFNDIWYPAARMALINLEINGFTTEYLDSQEGLIGKGSNFQVYCEDVADLKKNFNEKFDICIIDTFPGVDTAYFVDSINELCNEIVII